VAILLLAVMHFIKDKDDPDGILAKLKGAMAPGSYLAVSHATGDLYPAEIGDSAIRAYDRASSQLVLRTRAEITEFFDGFELLDPGVVQLSLWRPNGDVPSGRGLFGGVGRKVD
jgi:hypothetical protein